MTDESYIKLAIEIAKKGRGKVSPNPLVGALIVKGGVIIGAGFHEYFGGNHAEVNAINNSKQSVEGATLFVNLEPCSHYGKTPPCTDLIIEKKIARVVIGTLDVNPLVSGQGVRKLIDHGIDVRVGVLENECIQLNKFFFKNISLNLPYVTLKVAQTIDGHIAAPSGDAKWITSVVSRKYVHNLRCEYDAVLIGNSTVKKDNPQLTVRFIEGRNPKRVVLDSRLSLSLKFDIFNNNEDQNLIIVTSKKSQQKKRKIAELLKRKVQIIYAGENRDGTLNLKTVLKELSKAGIGSILVEGGSRTFTSFVKENLFDDVLVFISPKILGKGIPFIGDLGIASIQKSIKLKISNYEKIGDDMLLELTKKV